jgi:general secretion pathway protein H
MTLLELLVVMAMLALLAGLFPLAMQRMLPARRLAAAARALTVDVRNLQSRAAVSGRPLQLILESSGYSLQQFPTDPATPVRLPNNVHITLKADEYAQPTHALVMYPDGSSSGGEFELRLDRLLTTVTVSAMTGHVHVSR